MKINTLESCTYFIKYFTFPHLEVVLNHDPDAGVLQMAHWSFVYDPCLFAFGINWRIY